MIRKKQIAVGLIGGLLGYAYYYFWGCENGCAIKSNPFAMVAYGAFFGLVLAYKPTTESKEIDIENPPQV